MDVHTTPENVLTYLHNVFSSEEWEAVATTKDFLVAQTEGRCQVQRTLKHYNLEQSYPLATASIQNRGVFSSMAPGSCVIMSSVAAR